MSVVVEMFGDVDGAWNAYASKAQLIANDPKLLSDRQFCEDLARLHERWRIMFLRSERTA